MIFIVGAIVLGAIFLLAFLVGIGVLTPLFAAAGSFQGRRSRDHARFSKRCQVLDGTTSDGRCERAGEKVTLVSPRGKLPVAACSVHQRRWQDVVADPTSWFPPEIAGVFAPTTLPPTNDLLGSH